MTGRMMTSINVIKLPDSVSNITGIERKWRSNFKMGFCKEQKNIRFILQVLREVYK